jgi:hypothetical protein
MGYIGTTNFTTKVGLDWFSLVHGPIWTGPMRSSYGPGPVAVAVTPFRRQKSDLTGP